MPPIHPKFRARGTEFLVERLEVRELMSTVAVDFTDSSFQIVSDKVGSVVVKFGEAFTFDSTGYATETVTVTAGGGTAVAGLDYQPVEQSVTLTPANPSGQITIPILPGSAALGTHTLAVTIAPSAASPQGSTEYIAIQHGTDNTLPKVISAKTETKGSQIVAFSLQFSKAMAIGPVENIANYAIPDPSSVKVSNTGTVSPLRSIALKSATYDPTTNTVVLIPSGLVKVSPIQIGKVKLTPRFYTIMDPSSFTYLAASSQGTTPTLSGVSPLTDLAGNPITDGNLGGGPNGDPGSFAGQGRLTKVDAVTARILQGESTTSATPKQTPRQTTKPASHHG